jgi:hypothetical protein
MENNKEGMKSDKKVKVKVGTDSLRVRKETKKKILSDLATINKKDFGRKVTADDFVSLAISLLTPEHLQKLKDASLSNRDRLDQRFADYCVTHGKVSKDEFLGILLAGVSH